MALRREIARVARDEPQPMLLGNGSLKRIGEFPAVIPAQCRSKIGGRLVDSERRKAIEESGCLARGALRESGQNLGARDYGNGRIRVVFRQVGGCRRDSVEMVDQDDRIQQQFHLRRSQSRRSRRWYASPSPNLLIPEVSRSRTSKRDGLESDSWRSR